MNLKMKKNFALSVFAALAITALAFTGCGDDPEPDPTPEPVKVTSVTVSPTTGTLDIGETLNLTAAVLPANADNKNVTWSSNPTSVATVSASGVVTAVAAGTATITATAADGSGKSGSCTVTVREPEADAVVTISLTPDSEGVNEIKYSEAVTAGGQPAVTIAATVTANYNIGSLVLTLITDNAFLNGVLTEMGVAAPFELGSLNSNQADALALLGIPSGADVIGKESVILPFSGLLPLMAGDPGIPGGINQFDVKIEAKGTDDKGSDTKTLKLRFVDDLPGTVTISGAGFDIDGWKEIVNTDENPQVKVNVVASKGIDRMEVGITSDNTTFNETLVAMGMGTGFDIANPGSLGTTLTDIGLANGAAVKGKTDLPFDISSFVPLMFMVADGNDMEAQFTLAVYDPAGGTATKTLKLRLLHDTPPPPPDPQDQLTNGGFEGWQQISNKWYPYASGEAQFWDTANKGLGASTQPTGFIETGLRDGTTGTRAVEMKAVTYMGQFAAGNMYTGSFGNITLVPIGANVNFGRPFTSRPVSLKGWYKASPGEITHAKEASGKEIGDPDEYQIYIMLTNWTEPRVVNTGNAATLIDFDADYVIGVGQISDTGVDASLPVNEWTQFNIPIVYKSDETPTHIVVVACVSRYADYLTGSIDSKLWIDDFELVYE